VFPKRPVKIPRDSISNDSRRKTLHRKKSTAPDSITQVMKSNQEDLDTPQCHHKKATKLKKVKKEMKSLNIRDEDAAFRVEADVSLLDVEYDWGSEFEELVDETQLGSLLCSK